MELDTAIANLEAATASVVEALRHSDPSAASREQLLSVVEVTHRVGNTLAGVQTVAVAHVAAIEDVTDPHGTWGEQHRGLGHECLDAPGLVGPILGITAQAATTRCEVAVHQMTTTPQLVTAMLAGDLDPWRARVVTTEVEICPDDGAHTIVDALVAHYDAKGRWDETTGPLRARVRRMIARAHPDVVAGQAKAAREGRFVRRCPATLGTDHWEAELPVERSAPMWQAVDTLARTLRRAHPDLTLAQARADALAQLVLAQATVTVHLHATVPADTPTPAAPHDDAAIPTADHTGATTAAAGVRSDDVPADTRRAATSNRATAATVSTDTDVGRTPSHPAPAPAAAGAGAGAAGTDSTDAATPAPANAHPGTEGSAGQCTEPAPRCAEAPGEEHRPTGPPRAPHLTEVGGLGSTVPTLLDLDALAAATRLVPSSPLTCDPDTGAVTGGTIPASLATRARKDAARRSDGYVVPADMARLVRLRDGRCRFPGCSTNAMYTDQDHVIAWPVGATTPTNLMCLCRRHHRIKQRHGWTVHLDPDGTAHWTDPTGRTSTTHPIDHLDRTTVPLAPTVPTEPTEPRRAATPAAAAASPTHRPTRLRPLDLDEVHTLLEDHLWRHLELLDRDGPPPPITIDITPAYPAPPPF